MRNVGGKIAVIRGVLLFLNHYLPKNLSMLKHLIFNISLKIIYINFLKNNNHHKAKLD